MSFTDVYFIFLFLPLFLIAYFFCPRKFRQYLILAGSLLFYWFAVSSRPALILLPVAEILIVYLAARILPRLPSSRRLIVLIVSVLLFETLLLFKYLGLFTGKSILLPAGLSFYTFQLTAYLYDVSRAAVEPETNILTFSSGILFFPKLLSGPITPWREIRPQLDAPKTNITCLDRGLRTFITGMGLKVLVADRVGGLWNQASAVGLGDISTGLAWLAALAFSLQLYFDFYGYSLMAIGIGQMLGFRLPVNFRHPYESRSMTDFWRRWHVTLGAWFRDYLYIPLGGNRVDTLRLYRNLLIVWLCTGIWHGSTWNFILWGLFLFVVIALEKLLKIDKNRNPLSYLYMIPATLVSWSIFACTDMKQLGGLLGRLFPLFSKSHALIHGDWWIYGKSYIVYLIVGIVLAMPQPAALFKRIKQTPIGTVILFLVFVFSVYCICGGLNDPFLYFNF